MLKFGCGVGDKTDHRTIKYGWDFHVWLCIFYPQPFLTQYFCCDMAATTGSSLVATGKIVSFPDPAFKLDKHFARNLGNADSALPEIWRTNQIAYTC